MALSSAETQSNNHSNKAIREFADSYLSGRLNVTPDDFIEAKEDKFHDDTLISVVQ